MLKRLNGEVVRTIAKNIDSTIIAQRIISRAET
jgi:hypothetical protein